MIDYSNLIDTANQHKQELKAFEEALEEFKKNYEQITQSLRILEDLKKASKGVSPQARQYLPKYVLDCANHLPIKYDLQGYEKTEFGIESMYNFATTGELLKWGRAK